MLKFDRNSYLSLINTQGANAALTKLHADIEIWEQETFEGEKGYQPQLWDDLAEARSFSRELWDAALKQSGSH